MQMEELARTRASKGACHTRGKSASQCPEEAGRVTRARKCGEVALGTLCE